MPLLAKGRFETGKVRLEKCPDLTLFAGHPDLDTSPVLKSYGHGEAILAARRHLVGHAIDHFQDGSRIGLAQAGK